MDLQIRKASKPVTSSLYAKESTTTKPAATFKTAVEKVESRPGPQQQGDASKPAAEKVTPPKVRATGKLDWSKAKAKIKVEESQAKIAVEDAEKSPPGSEKRPQKSPGLKAAPTVKDFFSKKVAAKSKDMQPPQLRKERSSDKSVANRLSEPFAKVCNIIIYGRV